MKEPTNYQKLVYINIKNKGTKISHVAVMNLGLLNPIWDSIVRTSIPLFLAFLFHAIVSWLEVDIKVEVGSLQVTNISRITIKLNCITTAFSSNPPSCCPLADAPCRLLWWTSWQRSIRPSIVSDCSTPWSLTSEFPKARSLHSYLCTNSVRWVVVAPPVTPRISRTRLQTSYRYK